MNTTSSAQSRRVILAGISEERLDLFLLLNEGAGYEVTGVIDTRGAGESSRIAEILGVPVLASETEGPLPDADLLIYGDERFRTMGERLQLDSANVWHENEAWRFLTEGEAAPAANNGEPEPREDAVARASVDWQGEEPVNADEPAPSAGGWTNDHAAGDSSGTSGESPTEPPQTAGAEPSPGPGTTPGLHAEHVYAPDAPFAVLHEFAVASRDVESLYRWVLEHAIEMSGAAAGGVRPHDAARPYVWQDRRHAERNLLPAFLTTDTSEPGVATLLFGGPETPGGGSIHLVGATALESATDIPAFLAAVAPALRTVAELDDHRRERAWEGIIRRLSEDLRDHTTEGLGDTVAETCRSLAETLGARECVLLFRSNDGEVVRGYSSNGQRIVAPAGTGLFGGDAGDRPRRLVDENGLWHYHVPFARGAKRGAMGLFGVSASPGSVEALGHQAAALARALAERFPEAAWQV